MNPLLSLVITISHLHHKQTHRERGNWSKIVTVVRKNYWFSHITPNANWGWVRGIRDNYLLIKACKKEKRKERKENWYFIPSWTWAYEMDLLISVLFWTRRKERGGKGGEDRKRVICGKSELPLQGTERRKVKWLPGKVLNLELSYWFQAQDDHAGRLMVRGFVVNIQAQTLRRDLEELKLDLVPHIMELGDEKATLRTNKRPQQGHTCTFKEDWHQWLTKRASKGTKKSDITSF